MGFRVSAIMLVISLRWRRCVRISPPMLPLAPAIRIFIVGVIVVGLLFSGPLRFNDWSLNIVASMGYNLLFKFWILKADVDAHTCSLPLLPNIGIRSVGN